MMESENVMIRDITIGQYYKTDSVIHRLDPRVKVVGTFVYIISLFLFRQFTGFLLTTFFLVWIVLLSQVPLRFLLRGLQPILCMLIFTAMLNLFWTPGTTLLDLGVIHITVEGVRRAVFLALRLILLILGSSIMTLTTTPDQLTDALESLLAPLKRLRLPVHEVAMMMSIALRFIPILIEETNKIMKAQMARGADFESGNVLRRLKSMIPILVPLFASSIRRATELANAMDARCYHGGDGRTKMKPLQYHSGDRRAYLVIGIYLVLIFCLGKWMPW